MILSHEPQVSEWVLRLFYVVGAIASLVYDVIIFVYAFIPLMGDDKRLAILAAIVMCFCLYAVVMHLAGLFTLCMTKTEGPCLISFARTSYWINFTAAAFFDLVAISLYIVTGETDYYFGVFIITIGLLAIALAWSMYVFCLFPQHMEIHTYYPLWYPTFALSPRYMP